MHLHNPGLINLFDLCDDLVDDQVGIIRRIREVRREAGAPEFFHFVAETCNTTAISRQEQCGIPGGSGAATDRETAMAKAIGEAVERYSSTIYDPFEFPLTSFDSAPFPCVPPSDFALYSHGQYAQQDCPYVPFDTTTRIRWVPAYDLKTAEQCYVPAAMVYLSYSSDVQSGEESIVQSLSTGLACHLFSTQAIVSAICEVIERDAFTITWQAMMARPQIRIETLSDRNRDLAKRFRRNGATVTLFDMTMEHGVPSILSALRSGSSEAPALVFAAATDLDPERAVRKSLEELAHTRLYAQWHKRHSPRLLPDPHYENVVTLHDHGNFYSLHKNASLAGFIFASKEQIDFNEIDNLETGDPHEDVKVLLKKISSLGYQILIADITSDDIAPLGLSVVRAMIPGFHPLFFGHKLRALGGSRLWEIPQKLGYRGITREVGDNPLPHPFP